VEALSAAWAKEWKKRLDASQAFKAAAGGWSGSLLFVMRADGNGLDRDRAVFLAIDNGRCRTARTARTGDLEECDLLLSASAETWRRVLQGSGDPVLAILSGQIRFERGRWSTLVPYAEAARELLRTAAAIDASFPHP
jgi:putative sterol carrier protein